MSVDIGPKIGIDGEAEFRKELGNINQQLRTLGSEMKAVTSAFAGNEKARRPCLHRRACLPGRLRPRSRSSPGWKRGWPLPRRNTARTTRRRCAGRRRFRMPRRISIKCAPSLLGWRESWTIPPTRRTSWPTPWMTRAASQAALVIRSSPRSWAGVFLEPSSP